MDDIEILEPTGKDVGGWQGTFHEELHLLRVRLKTILRVDPQFLANTLSHKQKRVQRATGECLYIELLILRCGERE